MSHTPVLVIVVNDGVATVIVVRGVGSFPPSPQVVTLTDNNEIKGAQASPLFRALCVDNAFDGTSTLILVDDGVPVDQADALKFLDIVLIPHADRYSAVQRNKVALVAEDATFDGAKGVKGLPAATLPGDAVRLSQLREPQFSGRPLQFGSTDRVLGSGTLHLAGAGSAPSSDIGYRMRAAGRITGASVQVPQLDPNRDFELSIRKNGIEVATLALPSGQKGAHGAAAPEVPYVAGDRISASMVRTDGSGASTFKGVQAIVETVDIP